MYTFIPNFVLLTEFIFSMVNLSAAFLGRTKMTSINLFTFFCGPQVLTVPRAYYDLTENIY